MEKETTYISELSMKKQYISNKTSNSQSQKDD